MCGIGRIAKCSASKSDSFKLGHKYSKERTLPGSVVAA